MKYNIPGIINFGVDNISISTRCVDGSGATNKGLGANSRYYCESGLNAYYCTTGSGEPEILSFDQCSMGPGNDAVWCGTGTSASSISTCVTGTSANGVQCNNGPNKKM